MRSILIFPNTLFENNHLIEKYTDHEIIIYEHPLFFTKHHYHKLKLILHRSSMKYYKNYIELKYKKRVKYYNFNDKLDLSKYSIIHCYDPVDYDIINEIKNYNVFIHNTQLFIETFDDLKNFNTKYPKAKHSTFYNWQKQNLNILHNVKNYDKDNRQKFPKLYKESYEIKIESDEYIKEAQKYVDKYFTNNFGYINFYLPYTHSESKKHFKEFLKRRFRYFGTYQDAISKNVFLGNHSLLSPLLNIGLITPKYVIDKTLIYSKKNKIPINEVEAFIRQIIGWRSYVRYIYIYHHKKDLITNHFNHKRKLDNSWYDKINIEPVDNVIEKVKKYGYAHHIERLMIISNFMLLNRINPKYVIEWFYKFIDAYPWVMEPNVYGMGQYTNTIMMTRPYFSSSNYILKMSDYKKNDGKKIILKSGEHTWSEIWNALYYNFINDNKKELSKNYVTVNFINNLNNNKSLIELAKEYLHDYK